MGNEKWVETTLGNIVAAGGGSIQTGPFGSQLHASDYVEHGIPSIMPCNIGENRLNPEGVMRISTQDAKRLSRHLVRKGDIIYSRRGDVTKRALIRDTEDGWFCGTGCLLIRPGTKINAEFLALHLGHPEVKEWIVRHAVGATMPNLNTGILEAIPLSVPPLPIQKSIAHILGTLDDKIELNRRMNATLEGMAKAVFREWFVDGVAEKMPKEWRMGTIGEAFDLTMGQSPPGDTYNEDGVGMPFYQGCTDFGFRFPTRRIYCTAPTRFAQPNDTLVSVRAPVGQLNVATEECCVGRGVAAVRHKGGASSYTYYSIHNLAEHFAKFDGEGTVFGSINKKNFEAIPVVIPPAEVVAEYERKARPMDDQILNLEKQSRALAMLRDALLPKLLSGEIQISRTELILETKQ